MNKKANISSYSFVTFILILLLSLGNLSSHGQVLFGPKVGARASWVNFEVNNNDLKSKWVYGYSAGLASAFKVRNRFFLHADLMYTRKGKEIKGEADPALLNKAVYHYLSLPIIYRVDFKGSISGVDFKWFAGLGPNIDYWWKGRGNLTSSELDENDIEELEYHIAFDFDPDLPEQDVQYVEDVNRVQLGLLFAVGAVFEPLPNQVFLVEARFEWGHSYLAKGFGLYDNLLEYQDDMRARNQGIQISFSYLFDTQISNRKKGKSTIKNR